MMSLRSILLIISLLQFHYGLFESRCDLECPDKPVFHPSRLVVRHNGPAAATCFVCKSACDGETSDLEVSLGQKLKQENGTVLKWIVDKMTEWKLSPICHYLLGDEKTCCSRLAVTVYQPPDLVSISYRNHTGPLTEGHGYTLQCTVENVAPVGSLSVMFYRGQEALGPSQSQNKTEKTPVTEIFTLNIIPTGGDQGGHYWCEAKLELGPEGPQPPPVMKSENLTATVHYRLQKEQALYSFIITEGDNLQLNCTAVGNPSPSYAWTSPTANPSPFNASILTINSIAFEHEGKYTCVASNKLGNLTVVFNVDVKTDSLPIIAAVVASTLVAILFFACCACTRYYRHTRMGQYKLRDVFRFRKATHVAVSNGED